MLGVLTVLLSAAIWYGYFWYPSTVQLDPARAQPLSSQVDFRTMPNHPEDLVQAYNELTANQQERVNSVGWVDRQQGIVRVPVRTAFDMIDAQGMPEWAPEGE
ncbi:MAG: hypothetical protein HC828_08840 [Blastochloris sp.]|nr:hypothetical protein [Blastochloris sp.]